MVGMWGSLGCRVFALSRVTRSTLLAVRPREKVLEVDFRTFLQKAVLRASISSAGDLSRLHRQGNLNSQENSAVLPCHVGPIHFLSCGTSPTILYE